jgi:hypothetical protein
MAKVNWAGRIALGLALFASLLLPNADAHGYISSPISRNLLANTNCGLLPGKTCNYDPQSMAAGGPATVGALGEQSLKLDLSLNKLASRLIILNRHDLNADRCVDKDLL